MLSPKADGKMAKAGLMKKPKKTTTTEVALFLKRNGKEPKSRAADMKRSRDKRKAAGLVEFRCWIHPDDKHLLDSLAQDLSRARSIVTANRLYGAVVDDLQSG